MAYDIARALQSPNIVGNALVALREGEAHGKQNRLAELASQAYTTPAEGRNNLLQQMAAIDPDSAAKQSQAFATMDANQKAQVAAGLDSFAHTAASIAQDPDEQRAAAAYGQLVDHLASQGKDVSRFRSVPPKVGAQMALVQIASTKDLLDQAGLGQSYTLSPGAARFTSDNRQVAAQPVALQYHDVPMGQGKAAGVFNPANGTLTPAAGGAPPAPAADPMQAIIAQANQAIHLGAPREQVEAWMMQQAQSAGLGPQPMGQGPGGNQLQTTQAVVPGPQDVPAQFGVGTPKPSAASSTFTQLSPEEVAQLGLPAGTVAQRGNNGKIDVVSQPKVLSLDKQADIAAKRQKASQARDSSVATMDDSIRGIDALLASPGFSSLGTFTGDIATKIPHTDAANAKAQLDTVGNRSVLDTLSALKSLSATGASGFGALSEKEGDILRNAAANLNTSQDNESLKRNLLELRDKLMRTRDQVANQRISLPEDQVGGGNPAPPAAGGWSIQKVP